MLFRSKIDIKNEAQMNEIKKSVENEAFSVDSIKKGEKIKKTQLPFTTSTLQQEASKTLTFVIAAVKVVLPWSTCPIVPMLQCGFDLLNFSFAIIISSLI